jgi:hypothetical protein
VSNLSKFVAGPVDGSLKLMGVGHAAREDMNHGYHQKYVLSSSLFR